MLSYQGVKRWADVNGVLTIRRKFIEVSRSRTKTAETKEKKVGQTTGFQQLLFDIFKIKNLNIAISYIRTKL
jgi:hypothetical protein